MHTLEKPIIVGYALKLGQGIFRYPELVDRVEVDAVEMLRQQALKDLSDLKWGMTLEVEMGEPTLLWRHERYEWLVDPKTIAEDAEWDDENPWYNVVVCDNPEDATDHHLFTEAAVTAARWERRP